MTVVSAAKTRGQRIELKRERDRRACFADPCVFMERNVQIEEPDGTVIPLQLWPFQAQAVQALHTDRAVIVLKARRLGLSWIYLAYALWLAIVQQGVRVLILCKTEADAAELLDRIRRMRDRIATDPATRHMLAKLEPVTKTRDHVTALDIGASTIKALVGTPAAARSETAGLVLLDEFAFQRGAGEIWRSVLPTVEGGGRLGVISTGNGPDTQAGTGGEFARQWARAAQGISGFTPLFFSWQARPGRDQVWKTRALAQLGDPDRFRTEYPEHPDDAFVSPDTELVFSPAGIDAAVKLGTQHRDMRLAGTLPPPVGERLILAADWGVNSHILLLWPLEAGGWHVCGEVVYHGDSVWDAAPKVAALIEQTGWPVSEERYDASMPGLNAAFLKALAEHIGKVKYLAVPFNRYKTLGADYLRLLVSNTRTGQVAPLLSIDSQACPVLTEQVRGMKYADPDAGRIEKGDDHGFDALIAGVAATAAKRKGGTVTG